MYPSSASSAPSTPRIISRTEYTQIWKLVDTIALIQRFAPPTTIEASLKETELLKTFHAFNSKTAKLNFPTLAMQCIEWVHSSQNPKCVLFTSSPICPPIRLWPLELVKETSVSHVEGCLAQLDPKRPFSTLFFTAYSSTQVAGCYAENWPKSFKERKQIDLQANGQLIAVQWLAELKKALESANREAGQVHLSNLCLLLDILAVNSCCFFTEKEFAPFIATIPFEPLKLRVWRDTQFLRPDTPKASLTETS